MIELAPQHKIGLQLHSPLIVAAGCYGLGGEYRNLLTVESLGAVVVGPLTMRARAGAAPPRAVPLPDGVLLHTALDNPGLLAALRRNGALWARSPVPLLLHLTATSPEEVEAACRRLAAVEAVAAVELGLRDDIDPDEAQELVGAARGASVQPLLVRLPLADALWLAPSVVAAGADALTVAAAPRGTVFYQGHWISGRLYTPSVLPLALRALRQVRERVNVPLVGCGGVLTAQGVRDFLQAGAAAVQVDAALWHNPAGLGQFLAPEA